MIVWKIENYRGAMSKQDRERSKMIANLDDRDRFLRALYVCIFTVYIYWIYFYPEVDLVIRSLSFNRARHETYYDLHAGL